MQITVISWLGCNGIPVPDVHLFISSVCVLHLTVFQKESLSYPPTVRSRMAGPELEAGHGGSAAALALDPELQQHFQSARQSVGDQWRQISDE